VEGEQLLVGDVGYPIVTLPELLSVRRKTLELLKAFTADGGKDAGARAWRPIDSTSANLSNLAQ